MAPVVVDRASSGASRVLKEHYYHLPMLRPAMVIGEGLLLAGGVRAYAPPAAGAASEISVAVAQQVQYS